jgi:hypothetical protein
MRMLQLGGKLLQATQRSRCMSLAALRRISLYSNVCVHGSISPLIRSIQLNVVPGYTAATTAMQSILGCIQFIDRKRQYHRCSKGDDEDERG